MDSIKACKDCGREKKLTQFYVNKIVTLATGKTRAYHSPYCMVCHGRRTQAGKRASQDENLMRIWKYLETHPCKVCGEDNPVMLSFDHRERGDKTATLSDLMKKNWALIEAELAKCDVLCHNHHAVRTAAQMNWFKAKELRSYVEQWPENKKAYQRYAA